MDFLLQTVLCAKTASSGIIGLLSKGFCEVTGQFCRLAGRMVYVLQNFAYRINISWWVFAPAGGVALVNALLTVSYDALKAALAPLDKPR